jgi:ribonuclease D
MTVDYEIVETVERLEEVIKLTRNADAVAIDTEFARFNTYYPIVGLIQIFDGEHCYLIDPIEVPELGAIADLLEDESVVKVFHACSEDLEVFHHVLEALPTPLFDSQVAAAALGVNFSISYQKLVDHFLDLQISKEETRSDWLQRPLSAAQLDYAALDVIHLLAVYRKLVSQLDEADKLTWVQEECAGMMGSIATDVDPSLAYLRVKGLVRLDAESQYLVKVLCAWREIKAREMDVPRNRVVDEASLVAIAQLNYLEVGGLHTHTSMSSRQIRKYGDELLVVINDARMVPAEDRPQIVAQDSLPVSNSLMKQLKLRVSARAEAINIAPEMLARRRHLEQLLRSGLDGGRYQLPPDLCGWRKAVIGDELLALLAK